MDFFKACIEKIPWVASLSQTDYNSDMKLAKAIVPIFSFLLLLSLFIFFFFQNPITDALQPITLPIQKWVFLSTSSSQSVNIPEAKLQGENNQLRTELAKMQEVARDNQALHDQFKISKPAPQSLLPANIIGMDQNELFIDKGIRENVHAGDIVVVKDNLIGSVTKTTSHISLVTLLTDISTSFTAETAKTAANGIVLSQNGGSIIFANVVLSDKLTQNDIIMTKGNLDLQGRGYPPHLVVGKIVSISKQPSSLFQSAKVASLVDIPHLRVVFVMTK